MLISLKALSAILSYPTQDMQAARAELIAALGQDGLLSPDAVAGIVPLLDEIANGDIYDMQETYVGLFDRSRTLSLNLFEHVHGESRDRGSAMVDLMENYRSAGFEPDTTELPDHLPVLLEFLAMRPLGEGQEILADAAHILEGLRIRLDRRQSPYAAVFAALLDISGRQVNTDALAELLSVQDDDPNDLQALDQIWEESEVQFGPDPNAGCPQVRDMLANMDTPQNLPPAAAE